MKIYEMFVKPLFILLLMLLFQQNVFSQSKSELDAHKRKWDTPAWTDTVKNTMARYSYAADSGRIIYMKLCNVCHGNTGKGNGVAAAGLSIKPADHTSPLVQAQTDGSLFYELSNGHAPMPAYKTILSKRQRMELICFIRTLKPKDKTQNTTHK